MHNGYNRASAKSIFKRTNERAPSVLVYSIRDLLLSLLLLAFCAARLPWLKLVASEVSSPRQDQAMGFMRTASCLMLASTFFSYFVAAFFGLRMLSERSIV
ncbi:hypothetical protein I3842_03G248200 [Carya illinoinensis]|uniref:Uncharacterized protein n=1 Tax=Carya illinoinensis TaxID=32201 RepID=A0A922JX47_CARIL|nr:hypothetical protein I3842_03G248200 [Carya illinoinensis]